MMQSGVFRPWVAACLLAMAVVSEGATCRESMQVELSLGERDTRMAVRAAALDEMRARASQQVGMIVESTMVSTGQKLTEEIRTVGVSLVQIDGVKDEVRLQKDGNLRLVVTGTVTVDTSELDRRAVAMRDDRAKVEKIRQLAGDNQSLRRTLADITTLLGRQALPLATADLLQRQAAILESLAANAERVGQTFQAGVLLEMAKKDDAAWSAVQAEIDIGVLERILLSPVTAKVVRVESTLNGVAVLVQVGWDADFRSLFKVLERYVFLGYLPPGNKAPDDLLALTRSDNGVRTDRPFAERVYRYLQDIRIELEINVGGVRRAFPMMYASNDFMGSCGGSIDFRKNIISSKNVCFSFQSATRRTFRGTEFGDDVNPTRLLLSKTQAGEARQVEATWILKRTDGTQVRRQAQVL